MCIYNGCPYLKDLMFYITPTVCRENASGLVVPFWLIPTTPVVDDVNMKIIKRQSTRDDLKITEYFMTNTKPLKANDRLLQFKEAKEVKKKDVAPDVHVGSVPKKKAKRS